MERYALLVSGGIDKINNYRRYQNNLAFAYNMLVNKLGYKQENVIVLYADGRAIEYEGAKIGSTSATKANLLLSLRKFHYKSDWQLVIIISNHGGSENDGFINLWGCNEYITLQEFSQEMNALQGKKVVIMGQCYGGNIMKYNIKNTCIVTANGENLPSFSRLFTVGEEPKYDEFLYHFISYFNGCYPDGTELLTCTRVNSVEHAFQYAWENDCFNNMSVKYDIRMRNLSPFGEIPQFRNHIQGCSIVSL